MIPSGGVKPPLQIQLSGESLAPQEQKPRQKRPASTTQERRPPRVGPTATACRAQAEDQGQLSGSAGHTFGAAFGDVAVGFVPAHGALECRDYRSRLETQFAFRARAIHKHHVPGDLYAFDRNAGLAAKQPGESGIGTAYTESEAMGNFQFRRRPTGYL